VIVVRGNVTVSNNCKIQLNGNSSQLALYVQGNVTLNGGTLNANGGTSRATLFGGSSGGNIQFTNTSAICAAPSTPRSTR